MLKSIHILLGSSQVWNRYPKGSHTKEATKRSIIAYDDIKDTICKAYAVSEYYLVYWDDSLSLELIQPKSIIKRLFSVTLQFNHDLAYDQVS